MKNILKKKQNRIPGVCRALQIFSIVLFVLVLFFIFLSVISADWNLKKMTRVYVDSVEIDTQYFDGLKLYGFTDDMCRSLLEGDEIKTLTADVMRDRFNAIFHNTKDFDVSYDEARAIVEKEILRVAGEGKIDLEEKEIKALVDYTCDISGISTMYKFNTPAEYRTSIYDADRESIDFVNKFLLALSKISSPLFASFILLLYLSAICVMIYLENKRNIILPAANTALYPSIAILAFSIGEIFMPDASKVTDYIFRNILCVSAAGIVFGILLLVICKFIIGKGVVFDGEEDK